MPFEGAYAFVDSIVVNYPSLSSDIKGGSKLLAVVGNAVICAFGKDLSEVATTQEVRALSKKLYSNFNKAAEHIDVTSDFIDIIKLTLNFIQ